MTMLTRREFSLGVAAAAALALTGCAGGGETATGAGPAPGNAREASDPAAGNTAEAPEPEASSSTAPNQNELAADSTAAEPAEPTEPAEKETSMNPSAAAVVYFSCTGNTHAVAEKIAKIVDVEPMQITAAEPYTDADLDYNSDCRANVEQQNDPSIRPALGGAPDAADADTVYLGYPIWWGKVPRVILTYVESGALAGKTVVPFCTSGSSGIEGSIAELEAADPSATWESGRRFGSSVSEADLAAWIG